MYSVLCQALLKRRVNGSSCCSPARPRMGEPSRSLNPSTTIRELNPFRVQRIIGQMTACGSSMPFRLTYRRAATSIFIEKYSLMLMREKPVCWVTCAARWSSTWNAAGQTVCPAAFRRIGTIAYAWATTVRVCLSPSRCAWG